MSLTLSRPEARALPTIGPDYGVAGLASVSSPFAEPVVRCNECRKVLLMEKLLETGSCKHCGCRKVCKVKSLNDEDLRLVRQWDVDSEWLALFQEAPE